MSLKEFIRDDLLRRIESGEDLAGKISLAGLSRHYGVSFTPLRSALDDLVRRGYLTRMANRRLCPNGKKVRPGAAPRPVAVPRTASDWDAVLLKEVTLASLQRRPLYLREERLAGKLGVGRSIVRHALSRFSGARLIEHVPRRGWLVHPLSPDDMAAYLVIRETLELKALELARPRLRRDDLEGILSASRRGVPRSGERLDNQLHDYVIARAGNPYIMSFFQQYLARFYTDLFYHAAPKTAVVEEMVHQHQGILRALIAKDWTRARALLSAHIRAQGPILTRLLNGQRREPR
jgi:DNA-binding GntR family transcriptional regulator